MSSPNSPTELNPNPNPKPNATKADPNPTKGDHVPLLEFPTESVRGIIAWFRNPTEECNYEMIGNVGNVLLWIKSVGCQDHAPPVMRGAGKLALTQEEKIQKLEELIASQANTKKGFATGTMSDLLLPLLIDLSDKVFDKLKQWFGF